MFVEWSSTKYILLSKPLYLIDCHGNQKAEFAKNIQKSTPQNLYWGIKLKLCRNVHSISLYKNNIYIYIFFLLLLHMHFLLLWQFRISTDLKWEKWKLSLIDVLLHVFWQNFFRIVCWVVLYRPSIKFYANYSFFFFFFVLFFFFAIATGSCRFNGGGVRIQILFNNHLRNNLVSTRHLRLWTAKQKASVDDFSKKMDVTCI